MISFKVISTSPDGELITVACLPCPACSDQTLLTIRSEEYEALRTDSLIQDALPEMSAQDRELLLTGTHAVCWDKMMGIEE